MDERHWGLFYELLAHSPIKTIPLRTEMLRVISSALLCCVGLASAEAGISAANQAQILSLSADDRLAIVKRLEAVVQLLSSTYSQFFTPAMDNYVSFVSRVSQALIHLYVRLGPLSKQLQYPGVGGGSDLLCFRSCDMPTRPVIWSVGPLLGRRAGRRRKWSRSAWPSSPLP